MDLQGKVAIVTGGSGGLGKCICNALAKQGVNLAILYNNHFEDAQILSEELNASGCLTSIYKCDVTNPDEVSKTVETVTKDFKKIDILVNDAAYNIWIPFEDLKALTYEEWNKIININLTGPMLFTKAVANPMKLQGAGRIINIASVAGLAPVGSSIAYGVSKAGLIQLTKGMAVALAPDNILVNCIAPGYLEGTRMSDNLAEEYREAARLGAVLKKAADKDDIANQVVTFCKTDTTTGQTLVIDGGRLFH